MTRTKPQPRNVESPFALSELFFSRTDPHGVIHSGNRVFTRVSGYTAAELAGRPHNIIRHPDMPRAVFELLWESIKADRPICAYVKNLAKDGSYYWVFASVYPVPGGFLSIRLKPTSEFFAAVKGLYPVLLEREREGGMPAARAHLLETLKSLGFASYQEFMTQALVEEIRSRQEKLAVESPVSRALHPAESPRAMAEGFRFGRLRGASGELSADSFAVFGSLLSLVGRNDSMSKGARAILSLFANVKPLVFNLTIAAENLGESSRTLVAVAESFRELAQDVQGEVEKFERSLGELSEAIRNAEFKCGSSQLQAETIRNFVEELLVHGDDSGELHFEENCASLLWLAESYTRDVETGLSRLEATLAAFERQSEALNLTVAGMEVIRLRGLIEASHLSVGGEFESHVLAMKDFVVRIQEILLELNREWELARRSLLQARGSLVEMSRGVVNVGRELGASGA